MNRIETTVGIQAKITDFKRDNLQIGLVPTMGFLHDGHLELVRKAVAENPVVVVSIFVNPIQFNDPKDLEKYPRDLERDLSLLKSILRKEDIVFHPNKEEVYPEPDTRTFNFGSVAEGMEGAFRPGHFNGVGIVVDRLFRIITPDRAYFGEKDYQQLAVIRKLVTIEQHPTEIIPCPIVREPDGLAMSSRNVRINPNIRPFASILYQALISARAATGQVPVAELTEQITRMINQAPDLSVEYVQFADGDSLLPIASWQDASSIRCFIAAYAGSVRLIDNLEVFPDFS